MATKKNILSQSQDFVRESEDRQTLRELQKMKEGRGADATPTEVKVKPKTKAQQLRIRRPMQVSVHFTQDEKYAMDDAKTLAKRIGVANATVEDFVHGLVVVGLRCIEGNEELLKKIILEDENLRIS